MKLAKVTLIAALSIGSTLTQAAVFSDDFNSYAADQLNWVTQGGWYYEPLGGGGNVDIIGSGGSFDFLPGNGSYVDLDGSAGGVQVNLNHGVFLTGGQAYALSFDLAGNHRDNFEDVVIAHFNTALLQIDLNDPNAPFQRYVLNYTPTTDGLYSFGFGDVNANSNANIGGLLDNVTVTAVPEPETYALLLGGLGLIGFSARRRKTAA